MTDSTKNEFNFLAKLATEWLNFVVDIGDPEDVPFVLQQVQEASERLQAVQNAPTFKHWTGNELPALPDPNGTALGQVVNSMKEQGIVVPDWRSGQSPVASFIKPPFS